MVFGARCDEGKLPISVRDGKKKYRLGNVGVVRKRFKGPVRGFLCPTMCLEFSVEVFNLLEL